MTIGKKVKRILEHGEFTHPKTKHMTPGQSVRILRELQELTQNGLSELTGLPQSTISGIESGRINIGVERAKILARALKVHPAVIVFSDWETGKAS